MTKPGKNPGFTFSFIIDIFWFLYNYLKESSPKLIISWLFSNLALNTSPQYTV